MNIGEVAAATGLPAKTIRYYESIGLVRPALRTGANYRVYAEADLHTLRFIRRARSLGFSVEEVQQLLGLWRDRDRASADVKKFALDHVRALERKIAELDAMRRTLKHLAACCAGDERPECPILEDIAEGPKSKVPSN